MKIGIICVSDRCYKGECDDKSGPAIAECVKPLCSESVYRLVPDEKSEAGDDRLGDCLLPCMDDYTLDVGSQLGTLRRSED